MKAIVDHPTLEPERACFTPEPLGQEDQVDKLARGGIDVCRFTSVSAHLLPMDTKHRSFRTWRQYW
jgi:hypothetical protein